MSPCSRPASAGSISRSRTTCSRSQKHPVPSQLIGGNWLGDSPQVVNRLLFKDRTLCGRSGICVLLMAAATMLSGCGLIEVERVEQAAAEAAGRIGKYAPRGPEEPRFGKLVVTEQRWLGISVTEPPSTDLLPADLLEEGAVVLPLVGPQEDGILAARIEDVSGLSVRLVGRAPDNGAEFIANTSDGMTGGAGVWAVGPPARWVVGCQGVRLEVRREDSYQGAQCRTHVRERYVVLPSRPAGYRIHTSWLMRYPRCMARN